jgi:hypothetical protein
MKDTKEQLTAAQLAVWKYMAMLTGVMESTKDVAMSRPDLAGKALAMCRECLAKTPLPTAETEADAAGKDAEILGEVGYALSYTGWTMQLADRLGVPELRIYAEQWLRRRTKGQEAPAVHTRIPNLET